MNRMTLGLLAGMVMTASAGSASAATYVSAGSFAAANPNVTTVTFTGLTTDLTPLGSPYVKDGVTFSATNLYAVSTNFWGDYDSLLDNTFGGFITASFASTSAVGFYFASGYGDGLPVAVTLFNGLNPVFAGTATGGGVNSSFAFFGVDGVGSFDRLTISSAGVNGGFPSLGPISLAGAVPEPATWGLMILGFGAVGGAMRRRSAVRTSVRYA